MMLILKTVTVTILAIIFILGLIQGINDLKS